MAEKIDAYDLVSTLVLGLLTLCWTAVCFPGLGAIQTVRFPDAFAVLALTGAAVFAGQVVQALGSWIEPALYASWGGRPSDVALDKGLGDRYPPTDLAARLRRRLLRAAADDLQSRSLFLYAMGRAGNLGRVERFNGLYAYHRGLFVLSIVFLAMFLVSLAAGGAAAWPLRLRWLVGAFGVSLVLLMWSRARQRAFYYVREVLIVADRQLDQPAASAAPSKESPNG